MKHSSQNDEAFLSTIYRWLEECGEVLVFIEAVASSPDPCLFTTREQLQKKIKQCSKFCIERLPTLSIYGIFAVRNYDFPLRGIMDEAFAKAALEMMSKESGSEFLILEMGEEGYHHFGESMTKPSELSDNLDDYMGKDCVFGKHPKISPNPVPGIQVEAGFPIDLE